MEKISLIVLSLGLGALALIVYEFIRMVLVAQGGDVNYDD